MKLAAVLQAVRRWRVLFFAYAALLFVGTHWPNLKVETPLIERPDLLVHLTVFGLWFALCWLSGLCGPALRTSSAIKAAALSVIYAAIDEALQALPFVHRNAAWDDFGADCLGVASGLIAALILIHLATRPDHAARVQP